MCLGSVKAVSATLGNGAATAFARYQLLPEGVVCACAHILKPEVALVTRRFTQVLPCFVDKQLYVQWCAVQESNGAAALLEVAKDKVGKLTSDQKTVQLTAAVYASLLYHNNSKSQPNQAQAAPQFEEEEWQLARWGSNLGPYFLRPDSTDSIVGDTTTLRKCYLQTAGHYMPRMSKPLRWSMAHKELAILQQAEEVPGVVRAHEVCADLDPRKHVSHLILEYMPNYTLHHLQKEVLLVDEARLKRIAVGLCQALAGLHARDICHLNLRPRHIVLSKQGDDVKLVGFSHAMQLQEGEKMREPHQTAVVYMAPEAILAHTAASKRREPVPYSGQPADMWACGVILFDALTGMCPFTPDDVRGVDDSLVGITHAHRNWVSVH
jgi:serine/threonine protein kinase